MGPKNLKYLENITYFSANTKNLYIFESKVGNISPIEKLEVYENKL